MPDDQARDEQPLPSAQIRENCIRNEIDRIPLAPSAMKIDDAQGIAVGQGAMSLIGNGVAVSLT